MNPLQIFEANTVGRDFAIGDLHGSHSRLVQLLEHLKFDGEVDRMFSVGDVIDRGPDSALCLALNRESWFHSVFANHEQMVYEAFFGGEMGLYFLQNGGMWAVDALKQFRGSPDVQYSAANDEVINDVRRIKELPYVITVNLLDGTKVHLLHAEPPWRKELSDEDFSTPESVLELSNIEGLEGKEFLWGRMKFYSFLRADPARFAKFVRSVKNMKLPANEGLSRIISGHSPLQHPLTVFGQTNIDTAAYDSYPDAHGSVKNWAALTCVELNTWKFYQVRESGISEVEPLVINKEQVEACSDEEEPL